MLVISCHADTGFERHWLRKLPDGVVEGHLDNFSGVYAVMKAFFSGRLTQDCLRIELTYGEEIDMAGAQEVVQSLHPSDVVLVVDVTGVPTEADLTIEKCRSPRLRAFLERALAGMSFVLFEDCPDPVADQDEVDVYSEKCTDVCFLGVPCTDGDYNAGPVRCREQSLDAVADSLCRIAEAFASDWRRP